MVASKLLGCPSVTVVATALFSLACNAAGQQDPLPSFATKHEGQENPNSIPLSEATWSIFVTVLAAERSLSGAGHRMLKARLGLTDNKAQEVFEIMQSAHQDLKVDNDLKRLEVCGQLNDRSDRRSIARGLDEIEAHSGSHRADSVSDVASILGADAHQKFYQWAANRRSRITSFTVDHESALANRDPVQVYSKLCS